MAVRMKRIIVAAAAVAIAAWAAWVSLKPAPAPHVRFATLSGEMVSTAELRGKVVLVNFWATWCADCVREMPKMVETWRKYAPRGYEMLAVAVQSDDPRQVARFAKERALPFKVGRDATGNIAKSFGGEVRITPTSILIDRDGNIVQRFVGEPDWAALHATLEKLLAP